MFRCRLANDEAPALSGRKLELASGTHRVHFVQRSMRQAGKLVDWPAGLDEDEHQIYAIAISPPSPATIARLCSFGFSGRISGNWEAWK